MSLKAMKRVILICFLFLVFIVVETINWSCLALDHIFYRGYKKIVIKPPHFIIGMPRSATTFCYALLLVDSENTTAMKLWEILLAPSVLQKKLILFLKRIDSRLNNSMYKVISCIDRYIFQDIKGFHPISLFNFEEDDYLFLPLLSTISFSFIFPKSNRLEIFRQFDEKMTERQKRVLMNYYQGCIRRHLYVFGADKRYLSKSPSHTSKIKTLNQYFPECRFIYLLRDPLDTITSTICLLKQFKTIFYTPIETSSISHQTLQLADIWYKYPLISCHALLSQSINIVLFKELISQPAAVIRQLYGHLGLAISMQFEKGLLHFEETRENFKSGNQYSPAEFGLTRKAILDRYCFVYDQFIKY